MCHNRLTRVRFIVVIYFIRKMSKYNKIPTLSNQTKTQPEELPTIPWLYWSCVPATPVSWIISASLKDNPPICNCSWTDDGLAALWLVGIWCCCSSLLLFPTQNSLVILNCVEPIGSVSIRQHYSLDTGLGHFIRGCASRKKRDIYWNIFIF